MTAQRDATLMGDIARNGGAYRADARTHPAPGRVVEDVEETVDAASLTVSARNASNSEPESTVRFAATIPNTLPHKILLSRGWREVSSEDYAWDVIYADVSWIHENLTHKSGARLMEHQRINHFANHFELTRKDLMAKNVNRAKRQASKKHGKAAAEAFDIVPLTFVLPQEALMMKRAFREQGGLWIMKPIGRSQGKGIFVVNKMAQITKWLDERAKSDGENICIENYVAQRYISNPYCVGGRKFDLRLYVIVLSFRPLTAYLYREGFARFTASRYTCDKESIGDEMIHLTNHAVQKRGENYDAAKCDLRWSVRSLRQYISAKHGIQISEALMRNITLVIIHSLLAVAPIMINDRHCFEMYGYDVMLDDTLRPWLLEVNASPSMSVDSKTDLELKSALLNDVLNVIDLEKQFVDDAAIRRERVGGFDLIYRDGIRVEHNLTLLGGLNDDRERALAREREKRSSNPGKNEDINSKSL